MSRLTSKKSLGFMLLFMLLFMLVYPYISSKYKCSDHWDSSLARAQMSFTSHQAVVHMGPRMTGINLIQEQSKNHLEALRLDGYDMPWVNATPLMLLPGQNQLTFNQVNFGTCFIPQTDGERQQFPCNPNLLLSGLEIAQRKKNVFIASDVFDKIDWKGLKQLSIFLSNWQDVTIILFYRRLYSLLPSVWYHNLFHHLTNTNQLWKHNIVNYTIEVLGGRGGNFVSQVNIHKRILQHFPKEKIVMINFHDRRKGRGPDEALFCHAKLGTAQTCSAIHAQKPSTMTGVHFEGEDLSYYYELVYGAKVKGMVQIETAAEAHRIAAEAKKFQEETLNLTSRDFARICLPSGTVEFLFKKSLKYEQEVVALFPEINYEGMENDFQAEFNKTIQTKFCGLAAEQILIGKRWIAFFKSLSNKDELTQVATRGKTNFSDPFRLWGRRDQISSDDVNGVLERASVDGPCRRKSLHFSTTSLEQISVAVHRGLEEMKNHKKEKLVFGILGDSVAADRGGFDDALLSYLSLSLDISFPVEIRNLAKGGTGPQFTFYCNDIQGDEDIIIFEGVRPYEKDAVVKLAEYLRSSGFGVVLLNWRGPKSWGLERWKYGYFNASITLGIPLVNLNEDEEQVEECLPFGTDTSKPLNQSIYRDEVHPNRIGEIILAAMTGHVIEEALRQQPPGKAYSIAAKNLTRPRKGLSTNAPLCYNKLNCTNSSLEEFGMRQCLNVLRSDGFVLRSLPSGKEWWEGTKPGQSIEISTKGPCIDIVLFHNLRVTNGMVKVTIDGSVPASGGLAAGGILDGWYKGFWWLPRHRGHLREVVVAVGLQPKPHTIRLEVQNTTNSEDGTFKFDFTGVACSQPPHSP